MRKGSSPFLGTSEQFGEVAEWLNAPALKTGDGQPFVGSNPTLIAPLAAWQTEFGA